MPIPREVMISEKAASFICYSSLKPVEKEVITAFLKGNDVFCVLPTGYGKSLCFACLPTAFDILHSKESGHSLVIVISPLKALMEYQVSQSHFLQSLFISCITLILFVSDDCCL